MFKGQFAEGTVEGTGSALNVSIGFVPRKVEIYNVDGLASLTWTATMTDGFGLKEVTAGTKSLLSSNGISAYAGTRGENGAGFTIGADSDVNVSGETIFWVAYGEN